MSTLNLTKNEKAFIKMVINYDDVESQMADNFSNAGIDEAQELMGSKHAGAGLIGSLTDKGLGHHEDGLFWLTENKISQIYKVIFNDSK